MISFIRRKLTFFRRLYRYARNGVPCRVVKVGLVHGRTLAGKTVLITGGGSGIGLEMAKKFISEGAKVIITGRTENRLRNAVTLIDSDQISYLIWDVSDIVETERNVVKLFTDNDGVIDVLVNNAGISRREKFGFLTAENWDAVYNINLRGLVFLTQSVVNRWLQMNRAGVILNIASFAALELNEDAYGTSKSALIGLTRGLAKKYARNDIRVNAIAPGVIVGTDLNAVQRSVAPDGDLRCDWLGSGRYGTPAEVAELATFLISDASSYISGQTIVCDGGAI